MVLPSLSCCHVLRCNETKIEGDNSFVIVAFFRCSKTKTEAIVAIFDTTKAKKKGDNSFAAIAFFAATKQKQKVML
jgi:hypothetical protein